MIFYTKRLRGSLASSGEDHYSIQLRPLLRLSPRHGYRTKRREDMRFLAVLLDYCLRLSGARDRSRKDILLGVFLGRGGCALRQYVGGSVGPVVPLWKGRSSPESFLRLLRMTRRELNGGVRRSP